MRGKPYLAYLAACAGAIALAGLAGRTGLGRRLELASVDLRYRLAPLPPRPANSVILLVDRKSLAEYPEYPFPWPRGMYAPVVRYCKKAGARAVLFDMIFTETGGYGHEDDADLAAALAEPGGPGETGRCFGALDFSKEEPAGKREDPDPEVRRGRVVTEGKPPDSLPVYSNATLPVPEILKAYAGLGAANARPDEDSVFRRAPLFVRWDPGPRPAPTGPAPPAKGAGPDRRAAPGAAGPAGPVLFPSLPLRAFLAAAEPGAVARFEGRGLRVGKRAFPLTRGGDLLVRFYGPPGTIHSLPIQQVLATVLLEEEGKPPLIHPDAFKDKFVWIGVDLPGRSSDLVAAPPSGLFRGVEAQATVLENLLRGDALREPPGWVPAALLAAAALLATLAVAFIGRPFLAVGAGLALIGALVAATTAPYGKGLALPLGIPVLGAFFAFAGAAVVRFALEGRAKRWIHKTFQLYLSPEVVNRLADHPENLRLGGVERPITILFSDLAGFTSATERLPPERVARLLILTATFLTDRIKGRGGYVDKFIGDGVMAFWGGLVDEDHARLAVECAADVRADLPELREKLEAEGLPFLPIRVGLHTGNATVGNMGSEDRFNFTALGDAVNLASRLEGANKEFGTLTLISEETVRKAPDAAAVREVGLLRVVGRTQPIRVHELLGRRGAAPPAGPAAPAPFARGLERFQAGDFTEAKKAFQEAVASSPDPVADRYLRACDRCLSDPPPPPWDGALTLEQK